MTILPAARRARLAGLLLCSGLIPAAALAANAPAEAPAANAASDSADMIVVTGSKESRASELAAGVVEFGNAVQVVGALDIEASGATNFAEAVQFLVKGANIGYSPDEGEYTIRLDGGGDRDTLVVLDGVPLYDRGPTLETIWGSTTIDTHMIERIEVFRGGNSLFFGSNGGIGVVSVVTKKPDGTFKAEAGFNFGSFNTRELWGNVSFPLDSAGRHSLMIYGGSLNTDSPRIFAPESYVDNVAAGGGIQKFPVNRNNIGIKYLWKVDDRTEFRLNGQFTQIEFHDPFPDVNTYSPNKVQYPIVDLSLTRRWSDSVLTEFSGYYSNPQLSNTETAPDICRIRTGCPAPDNPGRIIPWGKWTGRNLPFVNQGFGPDSKVGGFREIGANLRNSVTFGEALELVAGVQLTSYADDSDPVFPVKDDAETITGVYVDVRPTIPFSPTTKLSLAARTDFASSFGSKTIWKFGIRQPFGDFYVRANGGTSYSAPQNNELFANSATLIGNPDLKTETTETYNAAIGFSRSWDDVAINAEVGGFRTDITNRIRTTSGLTPNTYFNDDRLTEIRGITADVTMNIGRQLSANVSYTRQQARPRGSDLQINETPEYMIQGNIAWRDSSERFHVTLLPRYQGPEYATGGVNSSLRKNFGNYFLMNASLGLWLGEERQHRFQLRVVNVFDEKYAERYGFGNMRYSEGFITGRIALNSPEYFYGYAFEGKPRSVFLTYSTRF